MPNLACSCGKQLTAPATLAGKKGKCPSCGAVLKVPGAGNPFDFDAPAGIPVLSLAGGASPPPPPPPGTGVRIAPPSVPAPVPSAASAKGIRAETLNGAMELSLKVDGGPTLRLGYIPATEPLQLMAWMPLPEFNNRMRAAADQLLQMAASQVQRKNLPAGSVIKNGWQDMVLMKEGSDLRICSPNFLGDATKECERGMLVSLGIAVMQDAVHKTCRVKPQLFHWAEPVAVERGLFQASSGIHASRMSPEDGKCEWVVTRQMDFSKSGEELMRIADAMQWDVLPAYAFFKLNHTLVAIFNMPYGYHVDIGGSTIQTIKDEHSTPVWPGKFV